MERLRQLQGTQGAPPPMMPAPSGIPPPGGIPDQYKPPTAGFGKRPKRKRSFSELPWTEYFSEHKFVEVGESKFSVYTTGSGPIVLCLHGGGHSALSWAVFTAEMKQRAGVQVMAVDQRGHGSTTTPQDSDLSVGTLTQDMVDLWSALFPQPEDRPPVVLLGHSMGGAVAVRIAGEQLIPNIRGVAVIDVVEGSALDALSSMQGILKKRPGSFETMEKAIEWHLKTGQLRNSESARVSVPGQLRALTEAEQQHQQPTRNDNTVIAEEEEEDEEEERSVTLGYTWRVELSASEQYWEGWYAGMSKMFLSVAAPKLLLLAGSDRLDTELTVAHMQGKYQLQVFNHSGHSVQEDLPDQVADIVSNFLIRQKIVVQ